jgi:hypothetical protein
MLQMSNVSSHKVDEVLHFFVLRNNKGQAVAVNIGEYPDIPEKAQVQE